MSDERESASVWNLQLYLRVGQTKHTFGIYNMLQEANVLFFNQAQDRNQGSLLTVRAYFWPRCLADERESRLEMGVLSERGLANQSWIFGEPSHRARAVNKGRVACLE